MTTTPFVFRLALAVTLLNALALAKQTPPAEASQEAAEKLLAEVDARIYYPRLEGLKDVSFRWQLGGTGSLEDLGQVWLAYAWKSPGKLRMQYVDVAGKPLTALPAVAQTKQGQQMFKQQEGLTHSMAQTLVIGLPLSHIYRDYYKELKSLEVNNKIEYRIIMRPKSKKAYTRIVIKIISGLPREFVKTNSQGAQVISRFRFKKRKAKWIPSGMKVEQNSQTIMDEEYHYVIKKGIHVLQSIERASFRAGNRKTTIKLAHLRVNADIPDAFFEGK